MNAEQATKMTDEFKFAIVELETMQNSGRTFSREEIRQQQERVALIEASIRTALLHTA